jgi:hypothetical protein
VRTLVETAHHEAWEILVEYRDVLDEMVLQLLEKETLGKEEVAAQVDAEVRALVENAHHEAWEILVEYRDVLDDMVLRLLDKETLNKDEVLEIFAPIVKRGPRAVMTANGRRPPSERPPVLTPAELAIMGPEDLEDLARGRKSNGSKSNGTKTPTRRRATAAPASSSRSRTAVNRAASPAKGKTTGRATRSSRRADPAS